jgi:hypothetical protein
MNSSKQKGHQKQSLIEKVEAQNPLVRQFSNKSFDA